MRDALPVPLEPPFRDAHALLNPNLFGADLLGEDEIAALQRVIRSGALFRYALPGASEASHFEQEMRAALQVESATTVANGTVGLTVALRALGVGPGDVVLVSAYTYIASAIAVLNLGADPVPVEFDPVTGLDLLDLRRKLALRPKAIMPVHLPGRASDVAPIRALGDVTGTPVVEDACQAVGASFQGRPAGTVGQFGVYSFQQNKQLTAGEGGCVVSNDADLGAKVSRLADFGAVRDAQNLPSWEGPDAMLGDNLRITELQAAVLRVQLAKLPAMLAAQRDARRRLYDQLGDFPRLAGPDPAGDTGGVFLFLMASRELANEAIGCAAADGVLLRRPWPHPFYRHAGFARIRATRPEADLHCPRSEALAARLLSAPLGPRVTPDAIDAIGRTLRALRPSVSPDLAPDVPPRA